MKVKGHELTNVHVKRVSLVDRGAIRAPFKIMKRDTVAEGATMKIFKNLFKSAAAAPVEPTVIAIAAAKSADQTAIKARLDAAGFSVDTTIETDDAILYAQEGAPKDVEKFEGTVIKYDDEVVAIVANVKKEFCPWNVESPTFGELMAVEGVYPTMSTAMEVLTSKVWGGIHEAKTPEEAATNVSKAFDDAKQFVSAYTGYLPVAAFKLDQFVAKKDAECADDEMAEGKGKKKPMTKAEKDEAALAAAKKAEEEGKTGGDPEDKGNKDDETVQKSEGGDTQVAELLKGLSETLKEVSETVKKMDGRLEEVETSVEDMGSRVAKAEKANTSMKATLKSALPGVTVKEDVTPASQKKQEYTGGLIDTGFSRAGLDD